MGARRGSTALRTGLLALLVACSGPEGPEVGDGRWDGHGTGTVTDGGVSGEGEEEPEGDPISLRLACQSYARARCRLTEQCLLGDLQSMYGSIDACQEQLVQPCVSTPGNSSDLLVPCLLDLQQMSCDQVEAWDWPSSC